MMKSKKESLLWEFTRRGKKTKSYLLGTMHIRDNRAFRFLDIIKSKINSCDNYAAEFNLDEPSSEDQISHLEFEEGTELETLIPEKKYRKLQRILQKTFQLDISLLNNILPIFISSLIAESILSKDKRMPLDNYLWEFAGNQNKNMMGIESYAEQLKILKSIPMDYQIKSLLEIGRNVSKYRRQILKITNYYENSELSSN